MIKADVGNEVKKNPYKMEKTKPIFKKKDGESFDKDGNKVKQLSIEQFSHEIINLIRKGDFDEALYQVNKNLSGSPEAPHLINLKAMALGMKGDHEGALCSFKQLNEMYPDNPDGLYQQSCALSALNRRDEAIDLLRKANELNHNDSIIPFNLGIEIIKGNGDINEAKGALNSARLMEHPRAHLVLKEINSRSS